ncbi:nickel ABC transporter substrate-binding protein [Desulfovibrio intestinalis]|uniref:Nickel transport system substrate-binding protein n=1 Tax=Desulfovibrio intestinalis TaxID=58621 RepID=A0A7W8C3D4_9BACT|nr:nickel ABC transporter substrate-binding protein [Desulfovibrio intestinalis]MBB5143697.1 nickel transport system substrate-binding protein [Desulfovibrio intestinalis]
MSYASTKDIRNINPHLYSGEMAAQNMVFEPLVINTTEGVKPWLAESWEISPDGKEYTFHLRKGVHFTDGAPFNAEAVKLNMDAIVANKPRHAWLDMVNLIDRNEVIDEHTFKLVMKHPYYPTLVELGLVRPFRFISPNCFVNGQTKDGVSGYAGTGPWVLTEHKDKQYALFTTNKNYWGTMPKLDTVRWRVMPDHQTIMLALQKGEIDLLFGSDGDMLNLDAFNALQKEGKYVTAISAPVASRAILLNAHQPVTEEKAVREALQYAVNKQAIAEGVLNGTESVADTLISPTVHYCDLGLPARHYDPAKAAELLDAAGWKTGEDGWRYKDGKKAVVRLYYNSQNAQERTIGEYMQSDLKKIGIEMKIIGEEKQAFLDRQKTGDFELQYSLSWGTPYDPQSYLSSWRIPAHGDYQAQVGLERKEWLDKAITELMIEPTEDARKKMYRDILTYIHDEGVYIPLTYSRTKAVHSKALQGVGFGASQYEIPFETMYFQNSTR